MTLKGLNPVKYEKHGMTGTKELKAWRHMITRCHTPSCPTYEFYGGRGIAVCDEFRGSFMAFLDEIGLSPSPNHIVDRVDNSKGYERGNVRWATPLLSSQNRTSATILTINGVSRHAADWSRIIGTPKSTICFRLKRGWTHQEAVFGRNIK